MLGLPIRNVLRVLGCPKCGVMGHQWLQTDGRYGCYACGWTVDFSKPPDAPASDPMPEPVIRNASRVRYFEGEDDPPMPAVVVTTRPPGHGLDLLVRDHAAGLGAWAEARRVLHRDRPERPAGEPCWLPEVEP